MALSDFIGHGLDRLLGPLFDKLKSALAPFEKLVNFFIHFFTVMKDAFKKGVALADEIRNEINEWRNFRENINVKNRVISLPAAISHTQDLLDEIKAAYRAIADLGKQIKEQLKGGTGETDPAGEAEDLVKDLESGGLKNFFEKFPKLAKAFEKVLGFVALIVGALESIVAAIDDLTSIVNAIRDIREEIETGSTVFLSQKNKRKIVRLDDGSTMKIRVGNLH